MAEYSRSCNLPSVIIFNIHFSSLLPIPSHSFPPFEKKKKTTTGSEWLFLSLSRSLDFGFVYPLPSLCAAGDRKRNKPRSNNANNASKLTRTKVNKRTYSFFCTAKRKIHKPGYKHTLHYIAIMDSLSPSPSLPFGLQVSHRDKQRHTHVARTKRQRPTRRISGTTVPL